MNYKKMVTKELQKLQIQQGGNCLNYSSQLSKLENLNEKLIDNKIENLNANDLLILYEVLIARLSQCKNWFKSLYLKRKINFIEKKL